MTSDELIRVANDGYPDDSLLRCLIDPDGDYVDTLAKFLFYELVDRVDPTQGDNWQLALAIGIIKAAISDLQSVASALSEKQDEIEREQS